MTGRSHGGRRLGAGRPRVADVQLTARVSSAASTSIKAYGVGDGVAAGVRRMADLSAAITAQLPAGSPVWVSFQPLAGSRARDVEDAYREILQHLFALGGRPVAYQCGRELLTVKARIPVGNDTSLWLSVPTRRIHPPSAKEYEVDLGRIKAFLINAGLDPMWA